MRWRDDAEHVEDTRCAVLVSTELRDWLTVYRYAEKGMLPFPGSWAQQHCATIEALDVIAVAFAQLEMERVKHRKEEEAQTWQ